MKSTHRKSCGISRREFLKLTGAAAASAVLAGCAPAQQPATTPALDKAEGPTGEPTIPPTSVPTDTPAPTSVPTNTPVPTSAPTPIRRPEIIRFWPDAPSRVVHTHHAGVWTGTPQGGAEDNNLLSPDILRQMLDTSITELTGLDEARKAWAALFGPDERVAIKVNTYGGSFGGSTVFTHVPLVMAVAQSLRDSGLPAEHVFVYDIATAEMEGFGYPINQDGPGVPCYGTGEDWDEVEAGAANHVPGWKLLGEDIGLSNILLNCDALINMPVLKTHSRSGLTFAMKNHYGSFYKPWDFHERRIVRAIAELNALPPIKDRTRLVVGDALKIACLRGSKPWSNWDLAVVGDSILMGFDPVAIDAIGLEYACQLAAENGETTEVEREIATAWLENAAGLGVGTNDPENIDLVEINLE